MCTCMPSTKNDRVGCSEEFKGSTIGYGKQTTIKHVVTGGGGGRGSTPVEGSVV